MSPCGAAVFLSTARGRPKQKDEIVKLSKCILLCILASGAGTAGSAWARHFHHGAHVGVYVGPSIGWGWYYPPPVYYTYPPVVMAPAEPPVYVEQGQPPAPAQPQPESYWYYCNNPDGYYPYVKQCPGGWQRVAPQPPSSSDH